MPPTGQKRRVRVVGLRPVLKHGPRSLTYKRVYRYPDAVGEAIAKSTKGTGSSGPRRALLCGVPGPCNGV